MCMGGSAPAPAAVPVAPPTAQVQQSDPQVTAARDAERQRRLQAGAGNNTLVTGGVGVTDQAQTALKQSFGQ